MGSGLDVSVGSEESDASGESDGVAVGAIEADAVVDDEGCAPDPAVTISAVPMIATTATAPAPAPISLPRPRRSTFMIRISMCWYRLSAP